MTSYSKSGGKLTSQPQRPKKVPGSDPTQPRTVRAVSVAALNLTPTPGGGYTTTPVSGANTRALAGTQIANVLQQCGLLNQPGGGTVPITFVSLEPVPDDNATAPITSGCGPSAPARDFVPRRPSMGYGNAGYKGNRAETCEWRHALHVSALRLHGAVDKRWWGATVRGLRDFHARRLRLPAISRQQRCLVAVQTRRLLTHRLLGEPSQPPGVAPMPTTGLPAGLPQATPRMVNSTERLQRGLRL
ncbi:hypothetical protein MTO96_032019 [Rhipicephalus appendiculatus]